MRRLSLNARLAQDAPATDAVQALLVEIAHPDLPAPILASSDNLDRISVEPLIYGTRSAWRSPDGEPRDFLFIMMSGLLPGDQDETPATATIALETVDNDIVQALRSTTTPATVAIAVVYADTPDLPEAEFEDFDLVQAPYTAAEIRLEFSEAQYEEMAFPADRLTKSRCPGMHP